MAATVNWNTAAPTIDGADISNFIGSTSEANNVNNGDDNGTYLAADRPGVGQTFTTGGNAGGYTLTSFSYQHVMYDSDTSFWSIDSGWGGSKSYEVKFGTISGGMFNALTTESVTLGAQNFGNTTQLDLPGGQSGTGAGEWWTFGFDTPILLSPNTQYAFSAYVGPPNGPYIELAGTNTDAYALGSAFTETGGTTTAATGDHVFHANLQLGQIALNQWAQDVSGNWNDATKWTQGVPTAGSSPILGSVITEDRTVTLNTNASLDSLTFSNQGDGDYFIKPDLTPGETLTLTGARKITTGGRHWIQVPLGTSGGGLNIAGSGELVLDATNTFSGGLNVDAALLSVTDSGAIPAGNSIAVTNGGRVRFFGSDSAFFGTLYNTGLDPNTPLTLSNPIAIQSAGSFVDVNDSANITFSGIISGVGSFGVQSGSQVTLSGANTYAGNTNVNSGVLTVTSTGKLGSTDAGTNLFNTGTVVFNGATIGDEDFGLGGESQLSLNAATLGSTPGGALIVLDENFDGETPKILSTGTSAIRQNILAGTGDEGSHYEIRSESGTLTLSGTLSAVDAAAPNDRNYVFSGAGNFNLTGRITDAEVGVDGNILAPASSAGDNVNVVKRGTGTLTINTASTDPLNYWAGSTVVEQGTLAVTATGGSNADGELATSSIEVQSGATFNVSTFSQYTIQNDQSLSGAGTINTGAGNIRIFAGSNNHVAPGDGGVGTLAVNGNVVLSNLGSGGSLDYELGNTTAIGGTENDLIAISGTLTSASSPVANLNVTAVEGSLAAGTYRLISHTGGSTSVGSFTPRIVDADGNTLQTRYSLALSGATAGQVNLTVSGAARNLFWKGTPDNTWSVAGTANFGQGSVGGANSNFLDLDAVTFGSGATTNTVNVTSNVAPGAMTVNGGQSYSFSGSDINATTVTVNGGATASFSNSVGGSITAANTGTLAGTGTFKDDVTVQSGGRLRIGGAALPGGIIGTVSWNVDVNGTIGGTVNGSGQSSATALAGVESVGNWTGSFNGTFQNFEPLNLIDNNGNVTSIDMVAVGFNEFSVIGSQPGQDADGTWNRNLINGYSNAGATQTPMVSTITVSEIPYGQYDIIAYFSSDNDSREGSVTDGTSTYYFNTIGGPSVSGANAVLTQATTTVDGATDPDANYAVFSSLSGSSQVITVNIPDFGGLAGIQIVGDPGSTALAPEMMTIEGDLALAANSIIEFDIAGSGLNDSLSVSGNLGIAAGSFLDVDLDGSVLASSLAAGDSWTLFNVGSITGDWSDFDLSMLPSLDSSLAWSLADGVLSVVTAGLLGDYNNDGVVNLADYTVWRDNLGSPETDLIAGTYTPGNGTIDGEEYALWKDNFGANSNSLSGVVSPATVPEPSSMLLLLGVVAGGIVAGRRTRRAAA